MEQKIKTEIETILNHEPARRPRTGKSAPDNRSTPPLDDSLRVFFASDTLQAPSLDSLQTDGLEEDYLK
jgi:hypothetical protein